MRFSPWVDVAVRAAREAGHVLMDRFVRPPRPGEVRYKGRVNPVTEADEAAEACIVSLLREAFPDHAIVAEEGGGHESDARWRWYVDPLDGTTNFAHRLPWFGVSLALAEGDEVLVGVVYHPVLDELFVAERGAGAWAVRGKVVERLQVSKTISLQYALVGTGTPTDIGITGNNLPQIVTMLKVTEDVRQMGSAAINLCSVAAGRLDAFWEPDLNPWDVAAGALMVLEAGGTVTGIDGSPYVAGTRSPLATNGQLHRQMLALLSTGGPVR
ncbi:MAG: inositol monophosphatase family protein [Armatimonadota bacterium]|nr:inositol monophosphatase family protein [Armatimonadota bacterium]MDR5696782.1 inositol monophosphatase family protein [Armatimonadota bacterium]